MTLKIGDIVSYIDSTYQRYRICDLSETFAIIVDSKNKFSKRVELIDLKKLRKTKLEKIKYGN